MAENRTLSGPEQNHYFDIPEMQVKKALSRIAKQAEAQLVFSSRSVGKLKSFPVKGRYTLAQALEILLRDTALSASVTKHGVIVVKPVSTEHQSSQTSPARQPRRGLFTALGEKFRTPGERVVARQDGLGLLEEVVVTATRRPTTLQDTPMSISALTGNSLQSMGYSSSHDFMETIPGVTVVGGDPGGGTRYVFRGIANSIEREGNATTATYVDEFPLLFGMDIKLVDMETVEVLKGPQGTLYGRSSMGGTLRFLTRKPTMESFGAGLEAGISTTENADGQNYNFSGYVNIPLGDRFAVRIVGYHYYDQGFIDSQPIIAQGSVRAYFEEFDVPESLNTAPEAGEILYPGNYGVGASEYSGGRLALRYQITENMTLDANFLQQVIETNGRYMVQPSLTWTSPDPGDFQEGQNGVYVPVDDDITVTSATFLSVFDRFDLTLAASHHDYKDRTGNDDTLFLANLWGGILDDAWGYIYDVPSAFSDRPDDVIGETLELRLVSNTSGVFSWMLGAWYEEVEGDSLFRVYTDSGRGTEGFNWLGIPHWGSGPGSIILDSAEIWGSDETAIYGELGYRFNEQLGVTLGYRRSAVFQWYQILFSDGPYGAGPGDREKSQEDVDTYRFIIDYQPRANLLLYASATSGYRAGGKNQNVLDVIGSPYFSDSLWNYEIGAKSEWLDGNLIANLVLYRIDWKDMQLGVTSTGGAQEIGNVGAAQITGLESEIRFRANPNFSAGFSLNHSDAALAEGYNPTHNPATGEDSLTDDEAHLGNRLPVSAKTTFSTDLTWRQQAFADFELIARLNHRYVGNRTTNLNRTVALTAGQNPDYFSLPSYNVTNLVISLVKDYANGANMNISLFADNLTNEVALTHFITFYSDQIGVNRPRTFGLRYSMNF